MEDVEFVVPLCPFEKRLLELFSYQLTDHAPQLCEPLNEGSDEAFSAWEWGSRMRFELRDAFEDERLHDEYGGDRHKAYDAFLETFYHTGRTADTSSRAHRVKMIRDDNIRFMGRLGDSSVDDVEFVPKNEDQSAWALLSQIVRRGTMDDLPAVFGESKTFNISQIIKAYCLKEGIFQVDDSAYDTLKLLLEPQPVIHDDGLEFEIEEQREIDALMNDELEPGLEGVNADLTEYAAKLWQRVLGDSIANDDPEQEGFHDDESETTERVIEDLKFMRYMTPSADPRAQVHAIPWEKLEVLSSASAMSRIKPLFLTSDEMDLEGSCWSLMKTNNSLFLWLHHLSPDDEEIYQHCIINQRTMPGYLLEESVVFRMTSLDSTKFIEDWANYWPFWNDCAVTKHPDNDELMLLETIPGIRFRRRMYENDLDSSRDYFRNVVETSASVSENTVSKLRAVLGEYFQPRYVNSLRLIPAEQITDIDLEHFFEGASGRVYNARWNRPEGVLESSNSRAGPLDVVLKNHVQIADDTAAAARLFEELSITYTALGGHSTGCAKFFGMTLLPRELFNNKSSTGELLFLVFEHDGESNLFETLAEELPERSFLESWKLLIDLMSSVATGLLTLADHGVIHRDLHHRNIMVKREMYSGTLGSQLSAKVIDVGEGKMLSDSRQIEDAIGSVGTSYLRAPEIRGGQGWSLKADVWAFGYILCRALEHRDMLCPATPPAPLTATFKLSWSEFSMPDAIRQVIQGALVTDPELRIPIGDCVRLLEAVGDMFIEDSSNAIKKLQWRDWDFHSVAATSASSYLGGGSAADSLGSYRSYVNLTASD